MRSLRFLLFILYFTFLCPALQFFSFADDHRSVQWEEIQGWRSLGPHWKGALNKKGELIAIYDLSFPHIRDRALLGVLDPSALGFGKVIDLLKKARDYLTGGNSLRVKSVNVPVNEDDAQHLTQVEQAIQELEKLKAEVHAKELNRHGSLSTFSDANWWKKVAWRSDKMRQSDSAPERFSIADIDLSQMVEGYKNFEITDEKSDQFPLRHIEFVKNSEGMYEFYWSEKRTIAVNENRPFKIVDLRCTNCGNEERLQKAHLRDSASSLISQIHVPYLAGVLSAALGEYYHFEDELLYSHQEMVLEMIRATEENSKIVSSYSMLSIEEKELAINYLLYARTGSSDESSLETWTAHEQNALSQAESSINYLKDHSKEMELLNPRFAIEKESDLSYKIYSLSAPRYQNMLSPFVAFDEDHPWVQRNARIAIETAHLLVQFLNVFAPYPFVGSIVSKAFDWILEGPMHTIQHWEARLLSHLYFRSHTEKNWDQSIEVLQKQTINPLELSKQDMERLIQSRQDEYAIP